MRIGVTPEQDLSPEQKKLFEGLENSPRGKVAIPFQVLAETPHLARAVGDLGAEIRYETTLTARFRELAILAVAATCDSGVEWVGHKPLALRADAAEDEINYAFDGRAQPACKDAMSIIDAVRALVNDGNIRDPDSFISQFGRSQTNELVVLVGYYRMLAMVMAVSGVDFSLAHAEQT